jgi:hypothetical protein
LGPGTRPEAPELLELPELPELPELLELLELLEDELSGVEETPDRVGSGTGDIGAAEVGVGVGPGGRMGPQPVISDPRWVGGVAACAL